MKIDRAIEILDPEHRENYDGMDEVNEACRMGMEALERTRWIPCSERMPEKDKKVLVYIPPRDGTTQYGYYIAQIREVKGGTDNFWGIQTADSPWTVWAWDYFAEPIVTHWQPLPELPKEGGPGDDAD